MNSKKSEPLISTDAIHSTAPKETKSKGLAGAVTAKLKEALIAIRVISQSNAGDKWDDRITALASAAIALAEQAEKEKSLDSQPSST